MRFRFPHSGLAVLFVAHILISGTAIAITTPLPPLTDELNPQRQEIGEGTRNLVLCIHGWNNPPVNNRYTDTTEWAWLVSKIKPVMQANTSDPWALVLYDWHQDADTGWIDFHGDSAGVALPQATQASINARDHGITLGPRLPDSLRRVHIITHSAGAWCAREVAADLLARNPYVVIQVTFLDPFIPEAVAPSGGLFSKNRIQELASLPGANRIWLLENYYADDFPAGIATAWTLGTQEVFSWGLIGMNLQVEWDPDLFHPPGINAYYDWHSGPTLFYGDTIAAADLGSVSSRLPPNSPPYVYQGYGWYNSLFHRTEPQWASLPRITTQPQNKTVTSSASVTLSVQGSSILPLNYQWFKRGQATAISGATGASYTFTASSAGAGDYVVRVSDSTGMIFSDFVTVTVTDAPPTPTAPSVASVLPSTLTGLPLPQTQLLRIIGSGFTATSTLVFNGSIASDPARLYFISANEIDYYIRTDTNAASWTVKVINGAQQSNLGYFTVVAPTPNTGSLTINLSPAGAVSAGAQWRVDGGSYRNSGDTAIGLTPGSHTVSFKSVSGYDKPAEKSVTITSGSTTTSSGTYAADPPSSYTLTVNYNSTKGYVTKNPNQSSYVAGTVVRLSVSANSGYVFDHWSGSASGNADPLYITMNSDKSVNASFGDDPSFGTVTVNISPSDVVSEGAAWKVYGPVIPINWISSGDTFYAWSFGNYSISFKPISGWYEPTNVPVEVNGGSALVINRTYQPVPGQVTVTLDPPTAITAGARWRLDGGAWQNSGGSLAGVIPGSHTIEFEPVATWTTPAPQPITVQRASTVVSFGHYSPLPGQPVIMAVSPPIGPLAGGTALTIDGANFVAPVSVFVGGQPATNMTVLSASQIVCFAPSNSVFGSVPVVVQTSGGSATNLNGYTYGVTHGTNIELVTSVGGRVDAVAVNGNYAYIGEGSSVVVLDVSNPATPFPVGRRPLPGIVKDIATFTQGTNVYACVAALDAGCFILDVTNPAEPATKGFFKTSGSCYGVAVMNGLAYVADGPGGLAILNLTNPAAPTLQGSSPEAGFANDVAVQIRTNGVFAYLSAGTEGLKIVDVSNPQATVVRGSLAFGNNTVSIVVSSNWVYLGGSVYSRGANISNPDSPISLGQLDPPEAYARAIQGTTLYTAGLHGFYAHNVSTGTPQEIASLSLYSEGPNMAIANNHAYIAAGSKGLIIVSIATPSSPVNKGSYAFGIGVYQGIAIDGAYAYAACGNGGFAVLDVTNPALTHIVNVLPISGANAVIATNGRAYVLNNGSQIGIYSISSPPTPSLLGTVSNRMIYCEGMSMLGSYLLVSGENATNFHSEIAVVNVAAPASPSLLAKKELSPTDGYTATVCNNGVRACVGIQNAGEVKILDLTQPSNPIQIGQIQNLGLVASLAITTDGQTLFVGNYDPQSCLRIFDISNPANPVLISSNYIGGIVGGIRLNAGKAYLAAGALGVIVMDVTNPTAPQVVRSYDTPGSAKQTAQFGDYLYVADFSAGMVVLKLTDNEYPEVIISTPTLLPIATNLTGTINIGGSASDNRGVTRVTWSNSRGGGGEALGTNSWLVNAIPLQPGSNILTVTAFDLAGNSSNDTLTVIYQSPKQSQTITFPALTDKTFGDAPFTLAGAASSGLPVSFAILSGSATTSNNVFTITGAGTIVVRASQFGNESFNAALDVTNSFNVAKADQGITFTLLSDKLVSDEPFAMNATASSGLPVTFSIISGPATVTSNVVTLTGAGTVFVRALQPGNSNYNSAPEVERSFVVTKLPQFITFGNLSRQVAGDAPFELSASASSGLPVNFSVLSGPAIVSGNFVTMTGAGLVVLRASQSGDMTTAPAPSVDQVLIVVPGNNIITDFQRLANGMFTFRFYGDPGTNYVVQGTTDLLNWSALATNQVSGLGYLEFTDTSATNYSKRFYRIAPLSALILNGPVLSLTLVGNSVVVSWATNDSGYTLESATNLAPTSWTSNSVPPEVVMGRYNATNPISGGAKLYRLRK